MDVEEGSGFSWSGVGAGGEDTREGALGFNGGADVKAGDIAFSGGPDGVAVVVWIGKGADMAGMSGAMGGVMGGVTGGVTGGVIGMVGGVVCPFAAGAFTLCVATFSGAFVVAVVVVRREEEEGEADRASVSDELLDSRRAWPWWCEGVLGS